MRFAPDDTGGGHLIQAYDDSGIVIGGQRHTASLLVCAQCLESPWAPDAGPTTFSAEQLDRLLALSPQVLLLGTGRRALLPTPALVLPFSQRGIGVEIMSTTAACRTYNLLSAEGRQVVAVLMPPHFEAGGPVT